MTNTPSNDVEGQPESFCIDCIQLPDEEMNYLGKLINFDDLHSISLRMC